MSEITKKTNVSILKTYSTTKRQTINIVRFELPSDKNIKQILKDVLNNKEKSAYFDFLYSIEKAQLKDNDFLKIVRASQECIPFLTPKLSAFVNCILSLNWLMHGSEISEEYESFLMDLLVAHSGYCKTAITKLINYWIPLENDEESWLLGCPSEKKQETINYTFSIISKLLETIPMTFDIILETIEKSFPYYRKDSHVIAGYIHNILNFIDLKPMFQTYLITLIMNKLVALDVNTPRHILEEESEDDQEIMDSSVLDSATIFENQRAKKETLLRKKTGETLDICLDKLMDYIKNKFQLITNDKKGESKKLLNIEILFNSFMKTFETILLPTLNTHHVQFIIFYFCSLKTELSDKFIKSLWHKICDPNNISTIRQSAIGYMASILARAKFVRLSLLKAMLKDMCAWAHQYIDRHDSVQRNSIKGHSVFYSVCQAIFYVIAFRNRYLTNDKENIIYLQSLHLSSLVTSHLNPLKVCLPTIVQAFAGITRAYQIAYCHTIIEKNTRRKLITVHLNDIKEDECLDSFFPFDPCLLARIGLKINPIYYQYKNTNQEENNTRKRRNSLKLSDMDDTDNDFIVDKKQKISDLSKDFDSKFSYGAAFQSKQEI